MPLVIANNTTFLLTPVSGEMTPVITPWSARGVTVTLDTIGNAKPQLKRDVNGVLRDVSDVRFRKYSLSVTCRDGESPCLNRVWQGVPVMVDVPTEISYPVGDVPDRNPVPGSIRTQGSFTYYRPQLMMLVKSIRDSTQEYQAIHNWQLDLEEV